MHLGALFEIDVSTYEVDDASEPEWTSVEKSAGRATATCPEPTLTVEAEIAEQYEYAVHVFDHSRGRKLVAAIELVSPANKDHPEHRRAFVAKCAALLQQNVCVAMIDLVTTRNFNLYTEFLAFIERTDPAFSTQFTPVYAAPCRGRIINGIGMWYEEWQSGYHDLLARGHPRPKHKTTILGQLRSPQIPDFLA